MNRLTLMAASVVEERRTTVAVGPGAVVKFGFIDAGFETRSRHYFFILLNNPKQSSFIDENSCVVTELFTRI